MTICIATDGFPPQVGGIATFNQHLVTILIAAGHKVIVLYVGYDAARDQEDQTIHDGNLVRIILKNSYFKHIDEWKQYFKPGGFDAPYWIATGLAMRQWLLKNQEDHQIDIIEASDYGGFGIFLVDKKLPPIVITGHGSLLQFSRYNYSRSDDNFKVVVKLEQLSFLHADMVIAHSELNQHDLEKIFNREIELARIPWSLPTNQIEKIPSNHQLLVVGGLQPTKGVYNMAEALELLRSKAPGIRLLWIGNDTWLAPGQKQMSAYLQKKYPASWQQNFLWKNTQDFIQTQKQIAGAALIIIPSSFETFNYIALEAAFYKKPVIITTGTGVASVFKHSEDAWIIPPDNSLALADAINLLLNDPVLCEQLGEKARVTLSEKFIPAKILEDRIRIYENAITNRRNRIFDKTQGYSFIYKYRRFTRKYYYFLRSRIKKLIGK